MLSADGDGYYYEKLQSVVQSSTNAFLYLTNVTSGDSIDILYIVEDSNGNIVDRNWNNITTNSTSQTLNVSWTAPTTMSNHLFYAVAYNSIGDVIGYHEENFIPQLPSVRIDSYSTSATSSTNDVTVSGWDLVSGDTYQYQIKIHDSGNATIASSNRPPSLLQAQYRAWELGVIQHQTLVALIVPQPIYILNLELN